MQGKQVSSDAIKSCCIVARHVQIAGIKCKTSYRMTTWACIINNIPALICCNVERGDGRLLWRFCEGFSLYLKEKRRA